MNYYAVIALTGAPVKDYYFALNNIYDPDTTGTGHQPYGFDQWMSFYYRYTVFASSIRLTAITTTTTTNATQYLAVVPMNAQNLALYVDNVDELPYARSTLITPMAGNRSIKSVKNYMSVKKLNGLNGTLNPDDWSGSGTTSPPTLNYWAIRGYDIAGNNMSMNVQVKLVFYCRLWDRAELNYS